MAIKKFNDIIKPRTRLTTYGIGFKKLKEAYALMGINIYNKHNANFINTRRLITYYETQEEFLFDENLIEYLKNRRFFLNELKNYKSIRFNLALPCNGQRTQTNGRTCKNRRVEVKIKKEQRKKKLQEEKKPVKLFTLRDISFRKKTKKVIKRENKW